MTGPADLPIQRVTLITLGVADLDRAAAFYAALGWNPAERADGVAFYQMAGLALALFGRAELADLDEKTLASAVSETEVLEIGVGENRGIIDLLVGTGLVESRGAARRAIKEGGAYVNNVRIESEDWEPADTDLLHGAWLVLRRGKKNFAGVKINN